jgi:hypothetical protein
MDKIAKSASLILTDKGLIKKKLEEEKWICKIIKDKDSIELWKNLIDLIRS